MSDMGVKDGGLAECANMMLSDGELVPIVPPKRIQDLPADISYELLFVHKSQGFTGSHYIALYSNSIYYLSNEFTVNLLGTGGVLDLGEEIKDIKSVGNTLVVATNLRMRYFLWKVSTEYPSGAYSYLGSNIPSIDVQVNTVRENNNNYETLSINLPTIVENEYGCTTGMAKELIDRAVHLAEDSDILYPGEYGYSSQEIEVYSLPSSMETTLDEVISPINRDIWAKIAQLEGTKSRENKFVAPRFVRLALRLYDGSYIKHTVPILVGAEKNSSLILGAGTPPYSSENVLVGQGSLPNQEVRDTAVYPRLLYVNLPVAYTVHPQILNVAAIKDWKDIVKGLDIFISEPIYTTKFESRIRRFNSSTLAVTLDSMTADEKEEELLSKVNFYRIANYDVENIPANQFQLTEFSNMLGDNLVTQIRLPDDYRSNHEIWPEKMNVLNSRLNVFNIRTRYYQGPAYPASQLTGTDATHRVIVKYHIRGEGGVQIETYRNYGSVLPGAWLVYPDTRCFEAEVYVETVGSGYTKTVVPMKEHPFLSCAYSFLGFGINDLSGYAGVSSSAPSSSTMLVDHSYNKLYQSEVDNPFFFPLGGRHTVEGGQILGVASATKAMSQGQFGQFPLYVFCEEGIFAMQTAPDGTFESVAPLSRVVCSNPSSITGIDNAVVFASERGLMMLSGSDVQALSEDMLGRHFRSDILPVLEEIAASHFGSTLPGDVSDSLSFVDYLAGCSVAYDFLNARLILINPACQYQYVYALRDRTWHKMCFGIPFKRALNSYPDCFMQSETNEGDAVYNFSILDDANDVETRTFGFLVTRSMDFDDPFSMKSIGQIKHMGDYDREEFCYLLFGSRDGKHFIPVRSLKGSSFKFYRLALLARLLPTEHIGWTSVVYDTRFTNKLR